jgi:hypothetical protein
MKYRKRPVVIEAEQWFPGKDIRGVQGAKPDKLCGCCLIGFDGSKPHVHTIHAAQPVYIEAGDYIIPEPDGIHYYPCKPDIFEKTYEPAEVND